MSIQFWIIEDTSYVDHAQHIQNLLNQGWQISSSHVADGGQPCLMFYTTFLQRDTAAATLHKNGVHLASLMEVLEKRVNEVVERLEVVEATLDDDSTAADLAAPVAWIQRQMQDNRDLPAWYHEAVEEALAEDEADDDEPQWEPYVPPTEAEKAQWAQDAEAAKREFFSELARLDQQRKGDNHG